MDRKEHFMSRLSFNTSGFNSPRLPISSSARLLSPNRVRCGDRHIARLNENFRSKIWSPMQHRKPPADVARSRSQSVSLADERLFANVMKSPDSEKRDRLNILSNGASEVELLRYTPRKTQLSDKYQNFPRNRLRQQQQQNPGGLKPGECKSPTRMLDMPRVRDDFYTNILDWNGEFIATAVADRVYTWNFTNSDIRQVAVPHLFDDSYYWQLDSGYYVTSVRFSSGQGKYLAMGYKNGEVKVCDKLSHKILLNTKLDHRVSAMDWRDQNCLYFACSTDAMKLFDIRTSKEQTAFKYTELDVAPTSRTSSSNLSTSSLKVRPMAIRINVCSLYVSPPGANLVASASHSGVVTVWDERFPDKPFTQIKAHKSAIKAMSWNPGRPYFLATGGGVLDGCIKVWNMYDSKIVDELSTKSQICSLLWSRPDVLISGHGCTSTGVFSWRWPKLKCLSLVGDHEERVLHLAAGADDKTSYVASLGGDEVMSIWDIDREKPKQKHKSVSSMSLVHRLR